MSKEDSSQDMSRRKFLGATGAAITGISGCMGEDRSDSNRTSAQGQDPTPSSTETPAEDVSTPSSTETDTPGNNNQIQYWRNADELGNFEKAVYNELENVEDAHALTLDASQIDTSGLESTEVMDEYGKRPTLEHGLDDAVNGEYEDVTEIVLALVDPKGRQGLANSSVYVLDGDDNHIGSEGAYSETRESQVDALEHIDGDGVLHSSDLPEYVEQVLTGQ